MPTKLVRVAGPRLGWLTLGWLTLGLLTLSAPTALAQDDDPIDEFVRRRLESFPQSAIVGGEPLHATTLIPRFYRERGFRPAWVRNGSVLPLAGEVLAFVEDLESHGLRPADYHLDYLRTTISAVRSASPGGDTASTSPDEISLGSLVDLDLALTDAFLTGAAHMIRGKTNPAKLHPDWKASLRTRNLEATLEAALGTGDLQPVITDMIPNHPEYANLREGLRRWRELQTELGGQDWTAIAQGPKLEVGMHDPRIPALRTRLRMEGLPVRMDGEEPTLYDTDLREALAEFQSQNGLEPDGVVGPATLRSLNRGLQQSIDAIRVNLERWRWLPDSFRPRHIRVNIASFEVHVFDDGRKVRTHPCIVGKTGRKSPVFTGEMTYLVLNPYWTVTRNIAVNDKLPLIRKDPGYLAKNDYEVFSGWGADARPIDPYSVDWASVSKQNFPYWLRQKSGAKNALGRVKFMFPNEHQVYLHDTPTRELFDKAERAFSSGCIRVKDPLDLAEYVLRPDPAWDRARIDAVVASGKETNVTLKESIPVHLLYFTAWAEEGGTTRFRGDIYDRDTPVLRALDARAL